MNKLIKDALFGAAGGFVGTVVIGAVMKAVSKLQSEEDKQLEQRLIPEEPPHKLARVFIEDGLGIQITDDTTSTLGRVVQFGYGTSWGAAYGILRHRFPGIARAAGLPFGVGLTLLGWGALLPLFKLSPAPHKLPLSAHARGLVSHYAYAATVEGVCELCEAIDRAATEKPLRTKPELREVA
jgi:uncharacterized membrane protein YagU involved in acid resistance